MAVILSVLLSLIFHFVVVVVVYVFTAAAAAAAYAVYVLLGKQPTIIVFPVVVG